MKIQDIQSTLFNKVYNTHIGYRFSILTLKDIKNMDNIEVKNAPNALLSREILGDLSPIKETRKGNRFFVLIYIILGMPMMCVTMLTLAEFKAPLVICLLALLWLPLIIFMIGYEQTLIVQNHRSLFLKYIAQHFNRDEKFLILLGGRALKYNIPSWLPNDFLHRSYFIFTSDRILIITLKASMIKAGGLFDSLDNDFESLVSDVYCCDYFDKPSPVFGGFIKNILANISHTKIQICATGENEHYPWALENKGTKAGKLLNKIISRIDSKNTLSL